MPAVETYLKPEVLNQIKRLDLRAQLVVKGFLQGMHASPYQGFSVEFSEHRRYSTGDDPKSIDWLVYAKTDKYYVKRFEAETNLTGYLMMDLSRSMGFTHRQQFTKFEYSICLAAALCYLMIMQQDPVGLITFGDRLRANLPARSRRSQVSDLLAEAHLVLIVVDASIGWCDAHSTIAQQAEKHFVIWNKKDLVDDLTSQIQDGAVATSMQTGEGLDALLNRIVKELVPEPPAAGASLALHQRQRDRLQAAYKTNDAQKKLSLLNAL